MSAEDPSDSPVLTTATVHSLYSEEDLVRLRELRRLEELRSRLRNIATAYPSPHIEAGLAGKNLSFWTSFWIDIAELNASEDPAEMGDLFEDLLDRFWTRVTGGRRPYTELYDLQYLLLYGSKVIRTSDPIVPTLIVITDDVICPPPLSDRASMVGLFVCLEDLRDAFIMQNGAAAREAMATLFSILEPDGA